MHFIGNIIGGIFKVILSPLIDFIMSLLYGILIRGPLSILNALDHSFQYVSGSSVDKLLFSTSMADNKPQINFFASNSPLKTFFLIVVGVAGTLLVLFVGLMVVQSLMGKRKDTPINRLAKIAGSTSLIFAIPAGFLMALSLSGAVMGAISGQHIDMSANNVAVFNQSTIDMLAKLENAPNNISKALNSSDDPQISGMMDEQAKVKTYSLDQLYTNFSDPNWVQNDSIKQVATQVEDDYRTLKNGIATYDSATGGLILNPVLGNNIANVKDIINQLKPNIKDESMADNVKNLQDSMQDILNSYEKWVTDSNILLSYGGKDLTANNPSNIAINNYKIYFDDINKLSSNQITTISSFNDLATQIGYLISGNPANPEGSLISLRQHLTDLKENSLVVTFYQVATGNRDTNWDRSIGDFNGGGFMLLVGSLLIGAACVIMLLATLSAVTRIFDLGLLFIISPAVVVFSAIDEGQRTKTWANAVIAKLIGIFGIIICLRLFGMLNDSFKTLLDSTSGFNGNTGFMTKGVLEGCFGLGGMFAAYKGSQTLSSIVGAGYGISEGLNGSQAMGILRGAGGVVRMAAMGSGGGIASAIGMKSLGGGGGDGGMSPSPRATSRNPLKNISNTWKDRAQALKGGAQSGLSVATKLSRGKLGSVATRSNYVDKKLNKFADREARSSARASSKVSRPSDHAKITSDIKALRDIKKGNK